MEGSDLAEETTAVLEDIVPSDDSSAKQSVRLGRWAAALCAAIAIAAVASAALRGGKFELEGKSSSSLEAPDSLGSIVELSSGETFAEMLDAVNHERQLHGLPDLCYNEKLNKAAAVHSDDMANHKQMSHHGTDGSTPSERITNAGYSWRMIAENVAAGQTSVSQVMQSWMGSSGHRANILKNGISHFGFATKDNYWTQVFASPLGNEGCQLAGGGLDGHGGRCRDVVPEGQQQWYDSDGEGYHCNWYAEGDRCSKHGGQFENFGYTAQQACCACGGGGGSGCTDKVPHGMAEWYDSDGENYHCDWYAEEPGHCAQHGDHYANHGLTAKQACCACGGGDNAADVQPTPAPMPQPSSGACCSEACQSHGDCGTNLFC